MLYSNECIVEHRQKIGRARGMPAVVRSWQTSSSDPLFQLILSFSRMWHVSKGVPESQLPATTATTEPVASVLNLLTIPKATGLLLAASC